MVSIGGIMADFRIRAPEDKYVTPDRSNCAILVGYETHETNGNNLPLAYVSPLAGETAEGKCVGVVSDQDAFILSNYGFILAASKTEGFPMPQKIKEALKKECGKCKLGDNCYVRYNLEKA